MKHFKRVATYDRNSGKKYNVAVSKKAPWVGRREKKRERRQIKTLKVYRNTIIATDKLV